MSKKALTITSGVVIVVLILLSVAYYVQKIVVGKYTGNNTPVAVLTSQNQAFASGAQYQSSGDYQAALQAYQAALNQAQDASQQAVIEYRIGVTDSRLGKYTQAIAEFQQIVANQGNYVNDTLIRAYSAQQIGYIYETHQWSSSKTVQSITSATFAQAPYSTFQQQSGSDLSLAYRHIFEYAAGFAPTAYSEGMIADWYANDLINTLHGATTTSAGQSDVSQVTQSLEKADAIVQATQNTPDTSTWIPLTLPLEGIASGELASVGAANPQQAETYFQQGIKSASSSVESNTTSYYYALFLAEQYGASRASDIANLLSSFKSGNSANIGTSMADFFKTVEAGGSYASQKQGVVLLASLDPAFKTYLISLGWHASDL